MKGEELTGGGSNLVRIGRSLTASPKGPGSGKIVKGKRPPNAVDGKGEEAENEISNLNAEKKGVP